RRWMRAWSSGANGSEWKPSRRNGRASGPSGHSTSAASTPSAEVPDMSPTTRTPPPPAARAPGRPAAGHEGRATPPALTCPAPDRILLLPVRAPGQRPGGSMNDSSRTQGGLICVGAVIVAAWFLLGLLQKSYWAIALPVAAVVF